MRARACVLFVAVAILAGCLEAAEPPEDEDVDDDVTPTPTPPIDEGTLFSGVVVGAGLASLPVPEGAASLEVLALPTLSPEGALTLRDPAGVTQATCASLPCDLAVDAPAEGDWTLEYDVGAMGADLHVRVSLPVDDPNDPDDPADPDDAQNATPARDLLYAGALDPSFTRAAGTEEHAFHVEAGYDALTVAGTSEDNGTPGRFALLDPAGEVRATCGGTPTCDARVESPASGLWVARHHAGGPGDRWRIEVHGIAARPVAPPSNYTAFDEGHTYSPMPGTNLTTGFYVRAGHQLVGWSAGFRNVDVQREEGRPIAVLRAPNGTTMARCQPGSGWDCPNPHEAAEGLWRVHFLGPATGEVDAQAFVFGPVPSGTIPPSRPSPVPTTPQDPPPPSPGSPRERYTFVYNTWPGVVGARHDHVPFLSTAGSLRGEIGPGVVLRNPGGEEVVRCQGTVCPVDLAVGWAGTWVVEYPAADDGFANLTFDEGVDGAAAVGGDGRFYTAIDVDLAPFPAQPIQRIFLPPGWSVVDANVTIDAAEDADTGRVEIRDPGGSSVSCLASRSPCAMRVVATPGQHGIELHGGVTRAHVRLVVS